MLTRLGILLLVSALLLFKLKTEEAQQLATNIPDVEKIKPLRMYAMTIPDRNLYGVIDESSLSCYKNNGEHIWTFTHRKIDEAWGLPLDKNGCIYIAFSNNNSIVVVSPDGKRCSSILSEHDGIHSPWSIDINTESGLMMVPYDSSGEWDTESFDSAFVYKIPNV
ncbi:Hypothetical predicted protein [Mytilus galloprovincialis]|uniref:Uncharacterized protein n=1 Tax=Mytilus galloprovincialis TaxID=29158 RepID=A0A8B6FEV7_MYTGA|nr:Hypothetical predicted protein [Mytilus galloprovincialis]